MTTGTRTIVWIDAEQALIVRWDGAARFLRIESEVPPHRRSTGHVRHEASPQVGGAASPRTQGEQHRQEHLRHFLSQVERRLEPGELIEIVGPGTVRERLARQVDASDRRRGRPPRVVTHAAGPLTEAQLVALVRAAAGDAAPRGRAPVTGAP